MSLFIGAGFVIIQWLVSKVCSYLCLAFLEQSHHHHNGADLELNSGGIAMEADRACQGRPDHRPIHLPCTSLTYCLS